MKIAAFNAKNLGLKKVTDSSVVQNLTKVNRWCSTGHLWWWQQCCVLDLNMPLCPLCFLQIVSRYSVAVILEVMDKSGEAMQKLHQELNSSRWVIWRELLKEALKAPFLTRETFPQFLPSQDIIMKLQNILKVQLMWMKEKSMAVWLSDTVLLQNPDIRQIRDTRRPPVAEQWSLSALLLFQL